MPPYRDRRRRSARWSPRVSPAASWIARQARRGSPPVRPAPALAVPYAILREQVGHILIAPLIEVVEEAGEHLRAIPFDRALRLAVIPLTRRRRGQSGRRSAPP